MNRQKPVDKDDNTLINELQKFEGVCIINMDLNGAGFGAMMLQTLNQIRFCERHNYLPVINYDETCDCPFFDSTLGNNMWAQYFEPAVPPYDFESILSCCQDPNHPLTVDALIKLSDAEMLEICEHHEDSIYSFTFADWRENPPDDLAGWYDEQRRKGRESLSRYIRVKQKILLLVESFQKTHFHGHEVLGIHIRGTDLMYAPPVSPAEYFQFVDNWLDNHSNPKVFVATDQSQYLDKFKERYGDIIIAYNCSRSRNEIVPFNMKSISPYKKGEDVLIDMLLLSKTNYLIKGASNVGEFAMYFNPNLECTDLSLGKQFAFGQDYGSGWNGGLESQTKPAWTLIKNTDLSEVASDANSQTRWQAISYKLLPYQSAIILFCKRLGRAVLKVIRFMRSGSNTE